MTFHTFASLVVIVCSIGVIINSLLTIHYCRQIRRHQAELREVTR